MRMRIGSSALAGGCCAPRRRPAPRPAGARPGRRAAAVPPERLPAAGVVAPRRVFRPDAERVVALRSVPLPFLRRELVTGSVRAAAAPSLRGRAELLGARVAMVTTVTTNAPWPK